VIEDLGSRNGTLLNGRLITGPEILSPGDRIQVGAATLVVQVSVPSAAEIAASPPGPPTRVEAVPSAAPDADTRSSAHQVVPDPSTAASLPPLSIQLDFDPSGSEVVLRLGDDSDPVRLIYENSRWVLAPNGGSS
jgi:hypothetical protein